MLYKKRYHDFGPTLASEKLSEMDGISISDETLRGWLIEEGLWKKRRKRSAHRQWRQRKECFGEMVQIDGSMHIISNGVSFKYKEIVERPTRVLSPFQRTPRPRKLYIPPKDHPWRRYRYFGSHHAGVAVAR